MLEELRKVDLASLDPGAALAMIRRLRELAD
jgi:hypothetical protein